jgi:hypothetical protein
MSELLLEELADRDPHRLREERDVRGARIDGGVFHPRYVRAVDPGPRADISQTEPEGLPPLLDALHADR